MSYGVPDEIVSDNGTEFKNEVLNKICDSMDIKRIFTTPYHPQVLIL